MSKRVSPPRLNRDEMIEYLVANSHPVVTEERAAELVDALGPHIMEDNIAAHEEAMRQQHEQIVQNLRAQGRGRKRSKRRSHRRSGHKRRSHRRSGHKRSGHKRSGHKRSGHKRSKRK